LARLGSCILSFKKANRFLFLKEMNMILFRNAGGTVKHAEAQLASKKSRIPGD